MVLLKASWSPPSKAKAGQGGSISFHDGLAKNALRDGNTPETFLDAGEQHAKAMTLLAIAGAAAWFFVGWAWSVPLFLLALVKWVQAVSCKLTAQKLERLMTSGDPAPEPELLPPHINLDDPKQVAIINEVRERYSALLMDDTHPYARCMFKPAALLPFPKPIIRRALTALLDHIEGRRESENLDKSLRAPEVAEAIRSAIHYLDDYIEVPAESLPTDPGENAKVGFRVSNTA